MLYHVTYRKRDGGTEVGRVAATSRGEALSTAAITFGVSRSSVRSAVACPPGKGKRWVRRADSATGWAREAING